MYKQCCASKYFELHAPVQVTFLAKIEHWNKWFKVYIQDVLWQAGDSTGGGGGGGVGYLVKNLVYKGIYFNGYASDMGSKSSAIWYTNDLHFKHLVY